MVLSEAVNSYSRVALIDLSGLGTGHAFDGVETTVLGQSDGDLFQSIGKSANGVLFHRWDLGTFFLQVQRASDLSTSSTINDLITLNEISDTAKGIMDTSFSFINNLLTASSDKNGDSLGFRTFFDDKHSFISGAEMQLFNESGLAQLFRGDFLESRDDSCASGHGYEFDVHSSDPSDSREFVL